MIRRIAILEPLIGRVSDCDGATHPIFDKNKLIKTNHFVVLGSRAINLDTKKIHSVMVTGSTVKADNVHNLSIGEYVFRAFEKEEYKTFLEKRFALYRDYFQSIISKNKTLVK